VQRRKIESRVAFSALSVRSTTLRLQSRESDCHTGFRRANPPRFGGVFSSRGRITLGRNQSANSSRLTTSAGLFRPLRKQINKALLEMYEDGRYKTLYDKWFSREY